MPHVDAAEVVEKLADLGKWDGAPDKQLYRTSLNGFTTLLVHPTMKTAVGKDGEPVNSDENLTIPGRQFVPKLVELPAQNIDDYLKKGFTVPTAAQSAPAEPVLPPATDPELEAKTKTELKAIAKKEHVELGEDDRTSVIIAKILAKRAPATEGDPAL